MSSQPRNKQSLTIVAAILICSAYLALRGLDHPVFWDDEAQVGIIARNYLKTGQMTGWDGRNLYAYANGTVLDRRLNIINPPLMFLACAASFKAFGAKTWAGRLPFALAGIAALALFAGLLRHDFAPDGWLWLYALGGLGLSQCYLLNIRQCRYYSLCILFSVAIYFAYRRYVTTKRFRDLALLTVAAILMFFSHYMLCVAFMLAVGVVHSCFYRNAFERRDWLAVTAAAAVFLIATLPYSIAARIWVRPDMVAEPWLERHLTLLWWNFRDLKSMGALAWPVAAGLVLFLYREYRISPLARRAAEWMLLAAANVLFVALLSTQEVNGSTFASTRYLVVSLPFLAGLTGIFLFWLHRFSRVAAVVAFAALLSSNLLLIPWEHGLRWLLPGFIQEIHRPFPTTYGETIQFIQSNVGQDQLVLADPNYMNYPLMFYTGDKVRFCCLINLKSPLVPDIAGLNAPVIIEKNFPDWVILFGSNEGGSDLLRYLSRPHLEQGGKVQYKYERSQALDVFYIDTTRPELNMHSFRPIATFNRERDAVYIYRKSGA